MKNESDKKSFFENYFTYKLFTALAALVIFIIIALYEMLFN
jgi:hypothetical protein